MKICCVFLFRIRRVFHVKSSCLLCLILLFFVVDLPSLLTTSSRETASLCLSAASLNCKEIAATLRQSFSVHTSNFTEWPRSCHFLCVASSCRLHGFAFTIRGIRQCTHAGAAIFWMMYHRIAMFVDDRFLSTTTLFKSAVDKLNFISPAQTH